MEPDRSPAPTVEENRQPYDLISLAKAIAEGEKWTAEQFTLIETRQQQNLQVGELQLNLTETQRIIWEQRLLLSELKKIFRGRFG